MCLQVSRYPETPATGVQVRTTLRSVTFVALKLLTFGMSTKKFFKKEHVRFHNQP